MRARRTTVVDDVSFRSYVVPYRYIIATCINTIFYFLPSTYQPTRSECFFIYLFICLCVCPIMTNRRILLTVKISMTSYVRQTISLHAAFPPPTVKYYVRASIAHSTVQLPIAKKMCL